MPLHWTGQPPVFALTGPHPGGTSHPGSVNGANANSIRISAELNKRLDLLGARCIQPRRRVSSVIRLR